MSDWSDESFWVNYLFLSTLFTCRSYNIYSCDSDFNYILYVKYPFRAFGTHYIKFIVVFIFMSPCKKQTHDDENKSLGYMLQIVIHSKIITKAPKCHINHETIVHLLQQSNEIVELVHQFKSSGDGNTPGGQTFDDICFQVYSTILKYLPYHCNNAGCS